MAKYIYSDLVDAMEYLPFGVSLGIPVALLLIWLVGRTEKGKKGPGLVIPVGLYGIYLAILLAITFFSREHGSRTGGMDLTLFSTWGINERNNAFVIENILLFIPYGILCSWAFRWARHFLCCLLFGAATSVAVECLQLVTGRGYFQIDDILTNILGTVAGFLIFWIFAPKKRNKGTQEPDATPLK